MANPVDRVNEVFDRLFPYSAMSEYGYAVHQARVRVAREAQQARRFNERATAAAWLLVGFVFGGLATLGAFYASGGLR